MPSDCGEFPGEIFKVGGVYVGDFTGPTYTWEDDFTNQVIPVGFTPYSGPWSDVSYPRGGWAVPVYGEPPTIFPQFGVVFTDVVDDFTGPRGLEHMPALQVTNSGTPGGAIWWIGEDNMDATDRSDDSSGWNPSSESLWIIQYWTRSVPDWEINYDDSDGEWDGINSDPRTGATTVNNALGRRVTGYWGNRDRGVFPVGGTDVQNTWQFVRDLITIPRLGIPPRHPWIAGFGFGGAPWTFYQDITYTHNRGTVNEFDQTLSYRAPWGTVRFKCVHLYPYSAFNWTAGVSLDNVRTRKFDIQIVEND